MNWPQLYLHEPVLPSFDSAERGIHSGLAFIREAKPDNISVAIGDTGDGSVLVVMDNPDSVNLVNAIKNNLNLSPAGFRAAVCACVNKAGASVFLADDGDLMCYDLVGARTGPDHAFTAYSLKQLVA
jgi:hypothetical protein